MAALGGGAVFDERGTPVLRIRMACNERLGGRPGGMRRRYPANPPPFPEPDTLNPE